MKRIEFRLTNEPNYDGQVLQVTIFALPDQSPHLHVHERSLLPYVNTSTPKLKNSHYQNFFLTKKTTFLSQIMEGRRPKQLYVHVDPIEMIVIIEDGFSSNPCTKEDVYDILACFSFRLGNRLLGLVNFRDYIRIKEKRHPFILVKCISTPSPADINH